ncbi:PREDICTED: putative nuclease HARBI1 [Cyphomyrmex costatus]|uniref:putative nuclease HARBI1 n=1 Tax=Cyphomyrmex costatus TaxID=456900 RepID=UPI0008523515|nr:PREDICTED: putative nuclease HARBI1 [Cyphomyrmex costatus]
MDPNIMLMVIMKYLKQARDEPIRYAEITMQKVIRLFYLYMRYKELQDDRKNREMWVRPIFMERRRLLQGDSDNLIVEMRLEDPNKYFNYLRMSAVIFNELLNIVGPLIEKENVVRKPIPARTRLEVTIRWLASGDSMTSLSYAYRIAQCTLSRIIPETCEAIWLALKEKFMIDPTEDNWRTIAEDFATTCQFPNCIGAIDGKHVVIQAPPRSGSCYYNYKGNHSINLLATNALHIPPPTRLNNMDFEFPNILLGDEAFSLSTHMMRPYPRSQRLNISRKIFNYRLSRARRTVECAFGILVARWRIYRQPILACTSTAVKAVQATVILHNFIINQELDLPLAERQYCNIQEERNLSATNELTDIRNSSSRKSKALKIRDNFAHYFEHVNPLPWQWDKVLTNNF